MSNTHTFAIGDVHGRADLLELMLEGIEELASSGHLSFRIVFLGDIIDRGPDSRGAMRLVRQALTKWPGSRLVLGNHDHFVLRILDESTPERREMTLHHWLSKLGGDATLRSYSADPDDISPEGLRDVLSGDHINLMRDAEYYLELPQHILVHAGLAPDVPLASQRGYDLMWIKEPFLSSASRFEKTIVHGHSVTPSLRCEIARHRIAIDTQAYATGRLSAAHIHPDGSVDFFETALADKRIRAASPSYV